MNPPQNDSTIKLRMNDKSETMQWKIRIHDGYCEYEYTLNAKRNDWSIQEIYEVVRLMLDAESEKPTQVS